ncbi:helix-turn-helix domain-containing protein [Neobacillus vireti]|uniref:helix-turn-helix domain-containing protein n=1 Tax=Neobacillus vireti TaxID=220686 RepID=UPI003B58B414
MNLFIHQWRAEKRWISGNVYGNTTVNKERIYKSKVAEKLGVSRSTIYRNLKKSPFEMAEWVESLQTRRKKLETYKELILSWLGEHPDMSTSQVQNWLMERNHH